MDTQIRKSTQLKFSSVLKEKLIERYGKVPSANRLANQFNLRARGTEPITQEAARRWIKGLSVPQIERFQVLSSWLGIRPQEFLEMKQEENSAAKESALCVAEDDFISMFRNLNSSEKHALQVAAKTMLDARKHPVI